MIFFAFVVGKDVGENAPCDGCDGVLRNVGVVDELLASTQEFLLCAWWLIG